MNIQNLTDWNVSNVITVEINGNSQADLQLEEFFMWLCKENKAKGWKYSSLNDLIIVPVENDEIKVHVYTPIEFNKEYDLEVWLTEYINHIWEDLKNDVEEFDENWFQNSANEAYSDFMNSQGI